MRLPGRPSCHYRWGVKWVSYFVIKYSHRIPGVSEIYDITTTVKVSVLGVLLMH